MWGWQCRDGLGPLRPPNSKASRKSCQSALSLSQSVQVAHIQGTRSDTTQSTHQQSWIAGESINEGLSVCMDDFMCCTWFEQSAHCAVTSESSLIWFSFDLLKCVYTHYCFSFHWQIVWPPPDIRSSSLSKPRHTSQYSHTPINTRPINTQSHQTLDSRRQYKRNTLGLKAQEYEIVRQN